MDTEDLELRLLARFPIYVDGIPVYSPELIDIADIGVKKYQQFISNCTIDRQVLTVDIDGSIDDYDILLLFITQQQDFLKDFLESLLFFTKKSFNIAEQDDDLFFFYVEKEQDREIYKKLNRDNYKNFVYTVRFVNCVKDYVQDGELDEFDRRILEAEKKMKELENQNSEIVPFKDLVSSLANMDDNNLNILNVWGINIFTFYDQMKRGQLKEVYIIGLKQLLAGAKPDEINLEHYIKKLE